MDYTTGHSKATRIRPLTIITTCKQYRIPLNNITVTILREINMTIPAKRSRMSFKDLIHDKRHGTCRTVIWEPSCDTSYIAPHEKDVIHSKQLRSEMLLQQETLKEMTSYIPNIDTDGICKNDVVHLEQLVRHD